MKLYGVFGETAAVKASDRHAIGNAELQIQNLELNVLSRMAFQGLCF